MSPQDRYNYALKMQAKYTAMGATGYAEIFGKIADKAQQDMAPTSSEKEFEYSQTHPGFAAYQSKDKDPQDITEFEYAKKQGFAGSFQDFLQSKHPGQTINVDAKTGEQIGTGYAKSLQASYDRVTSPTGSLFLLNNTNKMQDSLNQGIISGWGDAQPGVENFATIAANLGFGDRSLAANTQAYRDSMTQDVVSQARQYFPGSRITNADLNMAKIASGMDPAQQKEVLQEMIQVARERSLNAISQHNEDVNRFAKAYPTEGGQAKTMFNVGDEKIPRAAAPLGHDGSSEDKAIPVNTEMEARGYPKGTWVDTPKGIGQVP
jgi:hypothetical protein